MSSLAQLGRLTGYYKFRLIYLVWENEWNNNGITESKFSIAKIKAEAKPTERERWMGVELNSRAGRERQDWLGKLGPLSTRTMASLALQHDIFFLSVGERKELQGAERHVCTAVRDKEWLSSDILCGDKIIAIRDRVWGAKKVDEKGGGAGLLSVKGY